MNSALRRPGAIGSIVRGGGLVCGDGNAGDGVLILANSVTLRDFGVENAGRDGIRIGGYASSDPFYNSDTNVADINANSWNLDNVSSCNNVRDGFSIDDQKPGSLIDSNTGSANRIIGNSNGRYGLYANKTYLGSSFIAPLFEANTDYGIYLDALANGLVFIGGDVEGNKTGTISDQIYENSPGSNLILGMSVQGIVWNNKGRLGSFTPVVYGATTAGTATYTTQLGQYSLNDGLMTFSLEVQWTGHTGTGSLYVSLPDFAPLAATSTPNLIQLSSAMIAGAAGTPIAVDCFISPAGNRIQVYQQSNYANLAMQASGRLTISGSYNFVRPVASL